MSPQGITAMVLGPQAQEGECWDIPYGHHPNPLVLWCSDWRHREVGVGASLMTIAPAIIIVVQGL